MLVLLGTRATAPGILHWSLPQLSWNACFANTHCSMLKLLAVSRVSQSWVVGVAHRRSTLGTDGRGADDASGPPMSQWCPWTRNGSHILDPHLKPVLPEAQQDRWQWQDIPKHVSVIVPLWGQTRCVGWHPTCAAICSLVRMKDRILSMTKRRYQLDTHISMNLSWLIMRYLC